MESRSTFLHLYASDDLTADFVLAGSGLSCSRGEDRRVGKSARCFDSSREFQALGLQNENYGSSKKEGLNCIASKNQSDMQVKDRKTASVDK
jgi:hypothetical protein